MAATTVTGIAFDGQAFTLLARVEASGIAMVQSDIASIKYEIWRVYRAPAPLNNWAAQSPPERISLTPQELTVASVVYNTLQNDGRWSVDDNGYNFAFELAGTALPVRDPSETENRIYEIPVRFTPNVGSPFGVNFRVEMERFLYGLGG